MSMPSDFSSLMSQIFNHCVCCHHKQQKACIVPVIPFDIHSQKTVVHGVSTQTFGKYLSYSNAERQLETKSWHKTRGVYQSQPGIAYGCLRPSSHIPQPGMGYGCLHSLFQARLSGSLPKAGVLSQSYILFKLLCVHLIRSSFLWE